MPKNALEHNSIIRGIRGSGKTTILSDITNRLEQSSDFIVINASTSYNLLDNIAQLLSIKIKDKLSNLNIKLSSIIDAYNFSIE